MSIINRIDVTGKPGERIPPRATNPDPSDLALTLDRIASIDLDALRALIVANQAREATVPDELPPEWEPTPEERAEAAALCCDPDYDAWLDSVEAEAEGECLTPSAWLLAQAERYAQLDTEGGDYLARKLRDLAEDAAIVHASRFGDIDDRIEVLVSRDTWRCAD